MVSKYVSASPIPGTLDILLGKKVLQGKNMIELRNELPKQSRCMISLNKKIK